MCVTWFGCLGGISVLIRLHGETTETGRASATGEVDGPAGTATGASDGISVGLGIPISRVYFIRYSIPQNSGPAHKQI